MYCQEEAGWYRIRVMKKKKKNKLLVINVNYVS
jgi:hypothetical protein